MADNLATDQLLTSMLESQNVPMEQEEYPASNSQAQMEMDQEEPTRHIRTAFAPDRVDKVKDRTAEAVRESFEQFIQK